MRGTVAGKMDSEFASAALARLAFPDFTFRATSRFLVEGRAEGLEGGQRMAGVGRHLQEKQIRKPQPPVGKGFASAISIF